MLNNHLECFVCVAEAENFSKAARQMFLTPPAVTQRINTLEEMLGFRLFDRDNTGAKLTCAGEAFYKDAKEIVKLSEEAVQRARNVAGVCSSNLNIGTWVVNVIHYFPPYAMNFHLSGQILP